MTANFDREAPQDWRDELTPVDGRLCATSPRRIAELLGSGTCPSDFAFDRYLPSELRIASSAYWTPLDVALQAAKWFDELCVQTIVDIGSGPGKFCVAAALSGRSQFIGLEQRPRLVQTATELAHRFECSDRVSFRETVFGAEPTPHADAYYLYNPFGENLFSLTERLDADVELGEARHARDVAAARSLFESARLGTYVLTYNGFGGPLPRSYRHLRTQRELPNVLRLWQKVESP